MAKAKAKKRVAHKATKAAKRPAAKRTKKNSKNPRIVIGGATIRDLQASLRKAGGFLNVDMASAYDKLARKYPKSFSVTNLVSGKVLIRTKRKSTALPKRHGGKNPWGLQTASEALSLLDHVRQKNPAIKLKDGTVIRGKMVNLFLKEAKKQNPARRNIQFGFWDATGFHPRRDSEDYDYARAGENKPDRRTKSGKAGKTRTKRHRALKSSESVLSKMRKAKTQKRNSGNTATRAFSYMVKTREGKWISAGSVRAKSKRDAERKIKTEGLGRFQEFKIVKPSKAMRELTGQRPASKHTKPKKKGSTKKRNFATSYPWQINFKTAAGVADTGSARTKEDAIRRAKIFTGKRSDHSAEVIEVKTGKKTVIKRNPAKGKGKAQRNSYLMIINGKKKGKKRNSETDGSYETFHGEKSTRTDTVQGPDSMPKVTEFMGDKIRFYYQQDGEYVKPDEPGEGETKHYIDFSDDCFLNQNAAGTQYYLVAKPGKLPKFTPNGTFGPLTRVEYRARKPHLTGHNRLEYYYHVLGEENGKRPILKTDHDGLIIIKGGDYHTNKYGINN